MNTSIGKNKCRSYPLHTLHHISELTKTQGKFCIKRYKRQCNTPTYLPTYLISTFIIHFTQTYLHLYYTSSTIPQTFHPNIFTFILYIIYDTPDISPKHIYIYTIHHLRYPRHFTQTYLHLYYTSSTIPQTFHPNIFTFILYIIYDTPDISPKHIYIYTIHHLRYPRHFTQTYLHLYYTSSTIPQTFHPNIFTFILYIIYDTPDISPKHIYIYTIHHLRYPRHFTQTYLHLYYTSSTIPQTFHPNIFTFILYIIYDTPDISPKHIYIYTIHHLRYPRHFTQTYLHLYYTSSTIPQTFHPNIFTFILYIIYDTPDISPKHIYIYTIHHLRYPRHFTQTYLHLYYTSSTIPQTFHPNIFTFILYIIYDTPDISPKHIYIYTIHHLRYPRHFIQTYLHLYYTSSTIPQTFIYLLKATGHVFYTPV